MYICICIYVHMYMYAFKYVHICKHVFVYVYTYIYMYINRWIGVEGKQEELKAPASRSRELLLMIEYPA